MTMSSLHHGNTMAIGIETTRVTKLVLFVVIVTHTTYYWLSPTQAF